VLKCSGIRIRSDRQSPAIVFEHGERQALMLSDVAVCADDILTTSVGRTHQLGFDRNQCSFP
jgi:hypothetical protein